MRWLASLSSWPSQAPNVVRARARVDDDVEDRAARAAHELRHPRLHVQAAHDPAARARVVVLDEVVVDPQLGQHASAVGLQEEAALVAVHDGLEQQRAVQAVSSARTRRDASSLTAAWTRTSRSSASAGSGCRWRSPSPGTGARSSGSNATPTRLEALRAATMPFDEPGAPGGARGRARRGAAGDLRPRRRRRPRAPRRDHDRHAVLLAHRDRHPRHPRRARRPAARAASPGHCLILRSTVAPGTTDFVAGYLAKQRGFEVGSDVFVAHVPERIAAGRFFEEIETLPNIVGGVGEASTERAAELFEVFGGADRAHHARCRPSWPRSGPTSCATPTSRCPNLLMMDCERYGANVFEVIDLINRDYPRGGIAPARLHRRDLPAQGLRLLGGALQRARACCSRSRA